MKILVLVAVAGVVGGFAVAKMIEQEDPPSVTAASASLEDFNPDASVEQRLAALEQALDEERAARQLLEEELIYLLNDIPQNSAAEIDVEQAESANPEGVTRAQRRGDRNSRNSREVRANRLLAAGFDPGRAEWILTRESQLQMEALQMRYEAGRNGTMADFYNNRGSLRNTLRQELGDADYERYLSANGSSTNVAVTSVLDSSPAQSAGLKPGDSIVNYDGSRVFSMWDLTRQTMVGTPGERVVIDIVRDGTPMQVVLPRGPVGITGGR